MSVIASVNDEVSKRHAHIAAIKARPLTWAPTEGDGMYLYSGHELIGFVPNERRVTLARDLITDLPR